MSAVASPGDDWDSGYADPLPYLEIINEQLRETGHDELFTEKIKDEGYDLTKALDFRDWPIIDHEGKMDFQDGMFDVPESRIRVLGEKNGTLIHACYEKVLQPITGGSYTEIMSRAQQPMPFKWRVTYRTHSWDHCTCPNAKLNYLRGYEDLYHEECGRFRKSRVEGTLAEHVESLTLAPPDEIYNGFYPTLHGNDIAHYNPTANGMDGHRGGVPVRSSDGQIIKSGREIRNGRAEHRKATKGLISWDSGTQAHQERLKAEEAGKRKAKIREAVEKIVAQAPPSLGWD